MPPEIAQQASPQGAQSVFMAQGIGQEQPEMAAIQAALQGIQKLEGPMDELMIQLRQLKPAYISYLQVAAEALIKLRTNLTTLAKRSGAAMGSPQLPPTPQGNPASGPPIPGGAGPAEQ